MKQLKRRLCLWTVFLQEARKSGILVGFSSLHVLGISLRRLAALCDGYVQDSVLVGLS